jgi:membrane-associated phospholipid phosphatase
MRPKVRAPLAAAIASAGGVGVVAAIAYGSHRAQVLDARVLSDLVASPDSGAEAVAKVIRLFGNLPEMLAMLAIACAVGFIRGRRPSALAALVVVAGANVTTQLLKVLFSHPRIPAILGADRIGWDGFPSGHVTAVMSIAVAFAFVVPTRLRVVVAIVGTCATLAMTWAVLVLNMHYPSDVLGAVFVTGAWGFAALAGLRQLDAGASPAPAQLSRPAAISVK